MCFPDRAARSFKICISLCDFVSCSIVFQAILLLLSQFQMKSTFFFLDFKLLAPYSTVLALVNNGSDHYSCLFMQIWRRNLSQSWQGPNSYLRGSGFELQESQFDYLQYRWLRQHSNCLCWLIYWHIMYDCTSEIPNSDLRRYEFGRSEVQFGPSELRIWTFWVTNSDLGIWSKPLLTTNEKHPFWWEVDLPLRKAPNIWNRERRKWIHHRRWGNTLEQMHVSNTSGSVSARNVSDEKISSLKNDIYDGTRRFSTKDIFGEGPNSVQVHIAPPLPPFLSPTGQEVHPRQIRPSL